jgi:hypothetical protein
VAELMSSHDHQDESASERPLTPNVQSLPVARFPLMDQVKTTPLSRPHSRSSGRSAVSNGLVVKKNDEPSTGVILIGMDENDATTVGRTTTASRASSSLVDQHPSETNDTDNDEIDDNNNNNKHTESRFNVSPSRRSNSSSTAGRPVIPVMLVDRRRSTSTSSISSISSNSLRHRTSSLESNKRPKRTNHPRQTSSSDHPQTSSTTADSGTVSQRHSATEFQKFRDQLHSSIANPTIQPINEEWQFHPNPHHPKTKTEILRIERTYTPIALPTKSHVSEITNYDVLIPRFSPTYPTILREYGIGEGEWTGFIDRVNKSCMEAFDPFRFSNIVINMVAVLSCWISEWFMPNLAKRVLAMEMKLTEEINGLGEVYR